jgi:gamma-glutamyltranspeptidase/glutathione hydrolase
MDHSSFTTRPEIAGTFGVVASSHWIASQVGMATLERGGNAFDAAVSAAFVLHVVEPHMNGIGGDAVILIEPVADTKPTVVCGQGVAPAAATIDALHQLGHTAIPATGLAAAVVPGAFDAWMLILRDHGTLDLAEVLAPAIAYAETGAPVCAGLSGAISGSRGRFESDWPSSAAVYLPEGVVPLPGELLRQSALAATLRQIVADASTAPSREAGIDRARHSFAQGFVADGIDRFSRGEGGLLTGQDLAAWTATYESPLSVDYGGWQVFKAGPWTQGPLALQTLRLLDGCPDASLDGTLDGAAWPGDDAGGVHQLVESLKLAFADREAWYGDPNFFDVPLDDLLAPAYAASRRALISEQASVELRPGHPGGRQPRLPDTQGDPAGLGPSAEPTAQQVAASRPRHGDTCHLDVIDRWGNTVAATPSGGWLQGSPVIPSLGFPLGTRGQMFWLQEGLASSLRPGSRPRTTLTPSMAHGPDGQRLAFGSPGGDSQEQWSLQFFLRVASGRFNLQAAIDAPMLQSDHPPNSFFPRGARPNHLLMESRYPAETIDALRRRGHDVQLAGAWSLGHNCAALREGDGVRLRAAASPRAEAYATGR